MKSTDDTQLLNMLHSHRQHTAVIHCHVTQRNISIHFVLSAKARQTAIFKKLTVHMDCL